MNFWKLCLWFLIFSATLTWPVPSHAQTSFDPSEVTVELRAAPALPLPQGSSLGIDCNSPLEWDAQGNLIAFTSFFQPYRSTGPNLFSLSTPALPVVIYQAPGVTGNKWLEATYRASNGTLYGWYHNEPTNVCSSGLTAPRIGALVSQDDGKTWQDLGIVLEAPTDALNCSSANRYFAGGNGDFTVLPDPDQQYLYFFLSTYHRQVSEQGVTMARMSLTDLNAPVGKVWKWYNGGWEQPGLRGRVTVVFPALIDWHRSNANAYWGPAVHYNTYLNAYVMLLNHAYDKDWSQEGIYLSYNADLADPYGWSAPQRLPLTPARLAFYPEIIGTQPGETDKLAGQVSRFFLQGKSTWELAFQQVNNCGNATSSDRSTSQCDPDNLPAPPSRALRGKAEFPKRIKP